ATEGDYIRTGPHGYDQSLLGDLLERAEDGTKVYSDQNAEWMKREDEDARERAEDEWKAGINADADQMTAELQEELAGEDLSTVDEEMMSLIAMASIIDEFAPETIIEAEQDNDVIKQKLREFIDEAERPETTEPESSAAEEESAVRAKSEAKREEAFPRKEPVDPKYIDELSDIERYVDDDFSDLDPVLMEHAIDAINMNLGMIADEGYTFAELYHEPSSLLPPYLSEPMTAITHIGSGAIPAAKGARGVKRGDKRIKNPENIISRIFRWQRSIEETLGIEIFGGKEFKAHIQEFYPEMAKAADEFVDNKVAEPTPEYGQIQADMYESVGRDDLAEQSLQDAIAAKDEKRNKKEAPEPDLAQSSEDLFANEGQLEPDLFAYAPEPKTMAQVLTDSATAPEGSPALADIQLTAEDGDQSVTHNAEWWKNAIDKRIEAINKLRGCA
ncbi:MAG: hypothetical protein JRJ19_15850, partial [Deltaproteobacteria bacterium]|nr:hypothetical protein [Deltaproteobacteria bacterium]